MITIHILRASYGDSILVEVTDAEDKNAEFRILIDCSYNYSTDILPVLQDLNTVGKSIDRFIITHFDDDHISSAAKLIEDNGALTSPKIIPINQVWLNTYRHLQFEKQSLSKPNEEQEKLLKKITFIYREEINTNSTGEISARQAVTLGKELLKYGYSWNTDFDGNAIYVKPDSGGISIDDKVIITVLSPQKEQLTKLETLFKAALRKWKITLSDTTLVDDAFELLMLKEGKEIELAYTGKVNAPPKISCAVLENMFENAKYIRDNTPVNGSSIAFILEADNKRILFLADAHAETIIEQLQIIYPDKSAYPIFFDAVKVSHHGSFRNNPQELYTIIDSPNFLISTSGDHPSHKHPDAETLAFIVCRPLSNGIKKRCVTFNYMPEHLKGFFDEKLMDELNYHAQVATKINL